MQLNKPSRPLFQIGHARRSLGASVRAETMLLATWRPTRTRSRGWIKVVAGQEKTKFRGRDRVGWAFTFAAAAYNLVRLPKLLALPG
jgi:hypothetical protein